MEPRQQLLDYFLVFKDSEVALRMMAMDGYTPLQVRNAIEELERDEEIDPSAAYELTKALNMNSRNLPRPNPTVDIVDEKEGVFRSILGKSSHVGVDLFGMEVPRGRGKAVKVLCPLTEHYTTMCTSCALVTGVTNDTVECRCKKGEEYYLVADDAMPYGKKHVWNAYVASPQMVSKGGRRFFKLKARGGD